MHALKATYIAVSYTHLDVYKRQGVCLESKWPYALGQSALPLSGWDQDSIEQTLSLIHI